MVTPRDPHVLRPDHAPTPFTAADIRAGCPQGRTTRLLVKQPEVADQIRLSRFVDCDVEGAMIESSVLDPSGREIEAPSRQRVAWTGLQAHASFPADLTTIEAETVELPLGTLECLRYTVNRNETVDTFWFAKELPGMPVCFTSEVDGVVVRRSTMIGNDVIAG